MILRLSRRGFLSLRRIFKHFLGPVLLRNLDCLIVTDELAQSASLEPFLCSVGAPI